MFAECDGRKEVYFLKDIIYKNYKDTVFKTHKNFNLRAKMFSMPLKNNDTLSDLILKENSEILNDIQFPACYVLYLGMISDHTSKCLII